MPIHTSKRLHGDLQFTEGCVVDYNYNKLINGVFRPKRIGCYVNCIKVFFSSTCYWTSVSMRFKNKSSVAPWSTLNILFTENGVFAT